MRESISLRLRKAASILLQGKGGAGGFGLLGGSIPPKRGSHELLEAYGSMPWLRAVANRVSRAVAGTTWQIFAVRRNGKAIRADKFARASPEIRRQMLIEIRKQGQLEEIEQHPLLDMLHGLNYNTGSLALAPALASLFIRQLGQIYLDLLGEAFWIIERNGLGVPTSLWPIPPIWVVETPTPRKPVYRISFSSYQEEIPMSEILWIVDPDPVNPYGRGSGLARTLGDELETDEYAAKHVKSFFYNRARPDLIISADGLAPEDTRRLEERWLEKTQGFWKAFKPFFLNKQVKVEQLSQSFESMQLTELRKFERDTVIQTFGASLEIFGVIENSNRATIDAADYLFSRWVIEPRVEALRAFFQEKLVPQFDDRIILDYLSPVAEDKEFVLRTAQASPYSLLVDEWRKLMNLPPLPSGQGQVFMLPFNLIPTRRLIGASEGEPKMEPKRKIIGEEEIEDLLAELDEKLLIKFSSPAYKNIVSAFGQEILDFLGGGISFDLENPQVSRFITRDAFKFITDINQTTRDALRDTLQEGIKEGESIADLAKRVSEVFSEAKGTRATTIARTETLRASNFGATEGMRQGGVEMKEWIATLDDRVRDTHAEMDGQTVAMDEMFRSPMGGEAEYPGGFGIPEEDINCRCTVAPVVAIEEGMNPETRKIFWKKYDASLATWERRMKSAYIKGFQEQQDAVMKRLKKENA